MPTIYELAAELGMSERFVPREILAGRLSSHRFGRSTVRQVCCGVALLCKGRRLVFAATR